MQQKIKEIKLKFRQAMNGVVSHHMREQGADYKINFGLTLPLLKRIAHETPADAQLATALWNDTAVRESMMLAPMIYPIEEFGEAEADRWIHQIPNTEIADICCKYLFARLPFAAQKALAWCRLDSILQQYTGFQLASSRLIAPHREDEIPMFKSIAEIAISKAFDCHRNLAFAAITFLKQAVHDDSLSDYILPLLKNLSNENARYTGLFEDLCQERDLFKELSGNDSH